MSTEYAIEAEDHSRWPDGGVTWQAAQLWAIIDIREAIVSTWLIPDVDVTLLGAYADEGLGEWLAARAELGLKVVDEYGRDYARP